jgi:hypothetical protein
MKTVEKLKHRIKDHLIWPLICISNGFLKTAYLRCKRRMLLFVGCQHSAWKYTLSLAIRASTTNLLLVRDTWIGIVKFPDSNP